MTRHLFNLFLLGLLCAAWPGRVGAEVLGCQAVCLPNRVGKGQTADAPKVAAKTWGKPTGPTDFEKSLGYFALAVLVVSTVGLIAGLIDGHNVFIALLLIGLSVLCLFILSRILRAREKKNQKKTPAAPGKK